MATYITRFRVPLSGWSGGPGVNTFFALNVEESMPDPAAVQAFAGLLEATYTGIKGLLQGGVTATAPTEADTFDVGTGALAARTPINDSWTVQSVISPEGLSRASMIKCRFRTDRIVASGVGEEGRNRVLQGGIYIGPVSSGAIGSNGTVPQAAKDAISTAFDGLLDVAGLRLAVWSQPKPGRQGVSGYVQSVGTMPLPAVLRSRRD